MMTKLRTPSAIAAEIEGVRALEAAGGLSSGAAAAAVAALLSEFAAVASAPTSAEVEGQRPTGAFGGADVPSPGGSLPFPAAPAATVPEVVGPRSESAATTPALSSPTAPKPQRGIGVSGRGWLGIFLYPLAWVVTLSLGSVVTLVAGSLWWRLVDGPGAQQDFIELLSTPANWRPGSKHPLELFVADCFPLFAGFWGFGLVANLRKGRPWHARNAWMFAAVLLPVASVGAQRLSRWTSVQAGEDGTPHPPPTPSPSPLSGEMVERKALTRSTKEIIELLGVTEEEFFASPLPPDDIPAALPRAGHEWTSPTLGVMKWIPAGNFLRGSPSMVGSDWEHPQEWVTLTRGYWLMEHEVTQGQWQSVMGSNPSGFLSCGPSCPVEGVSWMDAQAFAEKASARGGGSYRLPTSAEWEYAARGGHPFTWAGSNALGDVGWYEENSQGTTHGVCALARNGFGLCDMSGNVHEWTGSWIAPYMGVPSTDPAGSPAGSHREVRGGSWADTPVAVRLAARYANAPEDRLNNLGLRLAWDGL